MIRAHDGTVAVPRRIYADPAAFRRQICRRHFQLRGKRTDDGIPLLGYGAFHLSGTEAALLRLPEARDCRNLFRMFLGSGSGPRLQGIPVLRCLKRQSFASFSRDFPDLTINLQASCAAGCLFSSAEPSDQQACRRPDSAAIEQKRFRIAAQGSVFGQIFQSGRGFL